MRAQLRGNLGSPLYFGDHPLPRRWIDGKETLVIGDGKLSQIEILRSHKTSIARTVLGGDREDIVAIENLSEILTVDHIDVFFVAPGDLAQSMGLIGQVGDPRVQDTIEGALEVMTGSGDPDATTVLDPFHVFRGGGSVESISLLSESQIAVSHFNDVPADPPREVQHDKDRVMPGDGEFDLARYIELLLATGYDRYLSLELFREDLWQQDPLEVAKTGLAKMQPYLEG